MITKALPIPEVTPFSYISRAKRPISPFYFREGKAGRVSFDTQQAAARGWMRQHSVIDLVAVLSRHSQTSRNRTKQKNPLKREDARQLFCLAFIMKKFIQK